MTLTGFVLSRIADQEAAAEQWQAAMEADEVSPHSQGVPAWVVMAGGVVVPARVLAECAALRAVVAAHPIGWRSDPDFAAALFAGELDHCCLTCHENDRCFDPLGYCDTLLALATIWSDHPDYRPEEWA